MSESPDTPLLSIRFAPQPGGKTIPRRVVRIKEMSVRQDFRIK